MVFDIATILNQWQAAGVFDYVLPFLLLFAVIFGILTGSKLFGENKAVHVIISLVVGLLALRLGFVQDFFREVFPRLGVAIAVIIVVVILVAVFVQDDKHLKGWRIGMFVLGAIVALIVIFNSFSALNWFNTSWWSDWGSLVIGALLVIGVIVAVVLTGRSGSSTNAPART